MKQWNNEEWKNKELQEGSGLIGPDPSLSSEEVSDLTKSTTGCSEDIKGQAGSEKERQQAIAKAMQLLLYRQRTEKELRAKLREKEYSPGAEEAAIRYVKDFGYLNDRHFAEVYLHSNQGKKSRAVIKRELQEKGVAFEWIGLAFEENPAEEDEIIYAMLLKRAGDPHKMEEKELRRHVQYLMRKGFSSADIWKQIHHYQEQAETERDM